MGYKEAIAPPVEEDMFDSLSDESLEAFVGQLTTLQREADEARKRTAAIVEQFSAEIREADVGVPIPLPEAAPRINLLQDWNQKQLFSLFRNAVLGVPLAA